MPIFNAQDWYETASTWCNAYEFNFIKESLCNLEDGQEEIMDCLKFLKKKARKSKKGRSRR
jgi:hypothetical protein